MQKGSPREATSKTGEAGQTQVLILAGIVLFLVVAGGIFYLGRITAPKPQPPVATSFPQPSPSPDETVYTESDRSANWKTYTNTKYGYSIKYPQEWIVDDLNTYSYISESGYDKGQSNIWIAPIGNGRGLWNVPTHESTLTIDGARGKRTDFLTEDKKVFASLIHFEDYNKNGWDPKSNTILLEAYRNPDDLTIFNQILSTVRFD